MFFIPLTIAIIHFIILTKSQDPLSLSQVEEPQRGANRLITAVRPKVTTPTWRSKNTTPRPGKSDKNTRYIRGN
ncbi:unnamed protein product [Meloidogyne enterolobii]|uniref:Uncharacterized protein n=1 Tax=Meloidogyne enterolobii TaxID=390850 RepID=A0ACB1AFU3_MELEN